MYRDHTKEIQIGDRKIGGGNPVLIQSMCNTKTENVAATVEQIHRLEDARMRHHPCGGSDHGSGCCDPRDQEADPYSAGC